MRFPAIFLVLITVTLFSAGCMGGPEDSAARLAEACDRQLEEIAEAEHKTETPTAPSTEKRLEEVTLVQCAGQETKVVAADADVDSDADGKDAPADGDEHAEGDEPAEGKEPAKGDEPAPAPDRLDPAARTLFVDSCGSCHALSDAETTGTIGPSLDDTEMDAAAVEAQIINGGGAMPAGLLQGEEAEAVAEYVAAAAGAE